MSVINSMNSQHQAQHYQCLSSPGKWWGGEIQQNNKRSLPEMPRNPWWSHQDWYPVAQKVAEHPLHLQNQKTCFHCISPYMIMYGRECVMPWELDGDLGPLGNEEDMDLPMEEMMERMYNIREMSLMLQLPTSKEHKWSRQGPTMPNTAEMHLKWMKNYGGRIHSGIQNRNRWKRWYGPYEVAERKDGGNGNYLLIVLSGKNRGQVSKKSYPPNKDVCVYTLDHWMRYPASGTSKRPTKNAFYLANCHNVHFDPVLGAYP